MLEDQGARGMPELMHGDAQSGGFLNSIDDLSAERNLFLVFAGFARKQPIRVASADQSRPEVMHVFIDERRHCPVEFELERFSVLHLVLREREPIVTIWATRLDQVFTKANAGEVTQPD